MEYKGHEIDDCRFITVFDPYKKTGSNNFQFSKEDLLDILHDFIKKENELKKNGLDPEDLYLDFSANDDYDEDRYQRDSECEITFKYQRQETEDEKDTRILKEMKRIDKEIKRKEEQDERDKLNKQTQINAAIDLLSKNGYTVKK